MTNFALSASIPNVLLSFGKPQEVREFSAEIRQSEVDCVATYLRRFGKIHAFEARSAKTTVTIYKFSRTTADLAEALDLRLSGDTIEQADYQHGGRMAMFRFVRTDKDGAPFSRSVIVSVAVLMIGLTSMARTTWIVSVGNSSRTWAKIHSI